MSGCPKTLEKMNRKESTLDKGRKNTHSNKQYEGNDIS